MTRSIISAPGYRMLFAGFWLCWCIVHAWIAHGFGLGWNAAITDSLVCNSLLAALGLVISKSLQYYLPEQKTYGYVLPVCAAFTAVYTVLLRWGVYYLPVEDGYQALVLQSLGLRIAVGFLLLNGMALVSTVWYQAQKQQAREQRKAEAEQLARGAELMRLRQQLQPHFLFNSLNSISALAGSQPEAARAMIQQLSDFLRGTIRKDEGQLITLKEELDHLQLYLDIEKVRFGHRLQTRIQAPEEALTRTLPALLLQPVLENAIKFGLYNTTGEVLITLTATLRNRMLQITITNPYDADTAGAQAGTGFGLAAVQKRLYLLYGGNKLLQTGRDNGVFTTTLLIPQITGSG